MKIDKYISLNIKDLANKKVIVTGANSGIGFSISKILASLSAHVVFACRSKERAAIAMDNILKEYPYAKMTYLFFDQSTFQKCKETIEYLKQSEHLDFDAIIYNAGVLAPNTNELNDDGLPITEAVNYINVVYISEQLEKLVSKEKEVRFIFQSSLSSRMVGNKPKILNNKKTKFIQYATSKYCLTNYVKYKTSNNQSNIKYLICEPGITNSNIIRNFPKFIQVLGNWFLNIFMNSTSKASLNAIMCVADININDGEEYRPGCMFSILGYPKLYLNKKKINIEVIEKTMELIDE